MGHRQVGVTGEDKACRFLRWRGYHILERNYRSPFGELDIIASRRKWLVFCEVKARSSGELDMALAAVDSRRQERMARTASHYLNVKGDTARDCRFDVIALLKDGAKWRIKHVKDAFEVSQS